MEKGVSEVLSYIYVFAIVMAVMAIVYLNVNDFIMDTKDRVLGEGIEQSFKRIQYTIYSVAFGGAPVRVVEIEVQTGAISIQNVGWFRIFLNNSTDFATACPAALQNLGFTPACVNLTTGNIEVSSNPPYTYCGCLYNISLNALTYEYGDWVVSLEGGGVFSKLKNQQQSKILSEPRIMNVSTTGSNYISVITIPELFPQYSQAGGRVKIIASQNTTNSSIIYINNTLTEEFNELHIFVDGTDYQDSWCNYFEINLKVITNFSDKSWCPPWVLPSDCNCNKLEEGTAHAYIDSETVKEFIITKKTLDMKIY
jgi:hypothetical protein